MTVTSAVCQARSARRASLSAHTGHGVSHERRCGSTTPRPGRCSLPPRRCTGAADQDGPETVPRCRTGCRGMSWTSAARSPRDLEPGTAAVFAPDTCPQARHDPWQRLLVLGAHFIAAGHLGHRRWPAVRFQYRARITGTSGRGRRGTRHGSQPRGIGVRRGLARRDAQQPITHCDSRRLPGRLVLAPVAADARSCSFRTLRAAGLRRQSTPRRKPAAPASARGFAGHRLTGKGNGGMALVADDLAAWLTGLLADTAYRKLTTLVLGSEQEPALPCPGSG